MTNLDLPFITINCPHLYLISFSGYFVAPSALALIVAATAITGTTVFYGISQLRPTSKPSEPAQAVPIVRQVTALGRLEPAAEVIKVSVPATLSNDRVAKLLVQRGRANASNECIIKY